MLIKLFGTLRLHGVQSPLTVDPGPNATVADVLEALFTTAPVLREHIVQPGSLELLPFVNIMVNGRLTRDLAGNATPVKEGDHIAIFPPSAGG